MPSLSCSPANKTCREASHGNALPSVSLSWKTGRDDSIRWTFRLGDGWFTIEYQRILNGVEQTCNAMTDGANEVFSERQLVESTGTE